MQTRNILLAALLTALAACQTETSAPKPSGESAMAAPAGIQGEAAAVPAAMTGKTGGAEQAVAKPVPPAPVAQTPKVATAAAVKPVETAPAQAAAMEAKRELKTSGVLSEADALALAKKSNCLACHAIAKKIVGPAWRDVAAKYRNDAGAESRLVDKVAKGGKGAWGAMAMPANPQVSEADRRKLVRFILSLK